MSQELIQALKQELLQVQKLSQQQLLQIKLLEMPLTELEESVNSELYDNPALESEGEEEMFDDGENSTNGEQNDNDFDDTAEQEERKSALDEALEGIGRDDEMPETYSGMTHNDADYEEIVYGNTTSFYDKIKEQMGETQLDEKQKDIMEYLIGSLDEDGLLRKDLNTISDELAIYHNIDATDGEIEEVLRLLQTFEPIGIGAKDLQECLLLQINNKPESRLKALMQRVISNNFDAFKKKHWGRIQEELKLTDEQMGVVVDELLKLNPKPGAALGETLGMNLQQITPDFIVDTADDGTITFSINNANIPVLTVSPSFIDMVDAYKNNKQGMSNQAKEALVYAKSKVERAQSFIEAIKQRQHTLYVTMKAIIDWQHKFFQDGDETELKPMTLKEIAAKTGLAISTISRVSSIKYAQTRWGIFPLRFFFTDSYTTNDGKETSTHKIKIVLKELISAEDKQHPMSDDMLKAAMEAKGLPVARRTIAKYREQMGIPVARLRK